MTERSYLEEAKQVEQMAAEQGPRWGSRKLAWLDGYQEGQRQARMTGTDHRAALRAVEEERREASELVCENCDDTGIYEEGSEWAPCSECARGKAFADYLKVATREACAEATNRAADLHTELAFCEARVEEAELGCERVEKQREAARQGEDEFKARAEQAEKQLAELRQAVRETVESVVDGDGTGYRHWLATDRLSTAEIAGELLALRLASLTTQPSDAASQSPRCGGSETRDSRCEGTKTLHYGRPGDTGWEPCPGCRDCTHKDETPKEPK